MKKKITLFVICIMFLFGNASAANYKVSKKGLSALIEEISERFDRFMGNPRRPKRFRRNTFKNIYGNEISCPITIITPTGNALCVAQKYSVSFENTLSPYDGYLMVKDYENYSYFYMQNVFMPLDVVFLNSNFVATGVATLPASYPGAPPYAIPTTMGYGKYILLLNPYNAGGYGIFAGAQLMVDVE